MPHTVQSRWRAALAAAILLPSLGTAQGNPTVDEALAAVVAGDWRPAEQSARDGERHPAASLAFFGLKPGMTILEVQPGGDGWWTQILAPYAARTRGAYYATAPDIYSNSTSTNARLARQAFELKFINPGVYGRVNLVNWGMDAAPLPADKLDFVLVSRSFHGWMRTPGMPERFLNQLFRATKSGGVLAIEQHRANPGVQDPKAPTGYVTEAYVIEQAEKAGFKLAAKSEINANPKDTKDHPFGVWTLPPMRANAALGSGAVPDPNFDRAKYDAIGESDRMTLRFVKP